MGVRNTLKRLERESGQFYETLRLEDGTEMRYEPHEMMDAFAAYIEGRDHRLLPYILRMDTTEGMLGLIRMLEESGYRHGD